VKDWNAETPEKTGAFANPSGKQGQIKAETDRMRAGKRAKFQRKPALLRIPLEKRRQAGRGARRRVKERKMSEKKRERAKNEREEARR